LVQNKDVITELVFLVILNVQPVLKLLIIVMFVLLEELILQNVLVQTDNILMKLMFAETVMLNVKLAQLMPSVLNVLMILTE
jgi:hypothetical protein